MQSKFYISSFDFENKRKFTWSKITYIFVNARGNIFLPARLTNQKKASSLVELIHLICLLNWLFKAMPRNPYNPDIIFSFSKFRFDKGLRNGVVYFSPTHFDLHVLLCQSRRGCGTSYSLKQNVLDATWVLDLDFCHSLVHIDPNAWTGSLLIGSGYQLHLYIRGKEKVDNKKFIFAILPIFRLPLFEVAEAFFCAIRTLFLIRQYIHQNPDALYWSN